MNAASPVTCGVGPSSDFGNIHLYYPLHGLVAIGFVALVPRVLSRCGLALGAYAAVSLAVPLTGNALGGIGRYAATLFPVFMLLGASTSRRTHETLLTWAAWASRCRQPSS